MVGFELNLTQRSFCSYYTFLYILHNFKFKKIYFFLGGGQNVFILYFFRTSLTVILLGRGGRGIKTSEALRWGMIQKKLGYTALIPPFGCATTTTKWDSLVCSFHSIHQLCLMSVLTNHSVFPSIYDIQTKKA